MKISEVFHGWGSFDCQWELYTEPEPTTCHVAAEMKSPSCKGKILTGMQTLHLLSSPTHPDDVWWCKPCAQKLGVKMPHELDDVAVDKRKTTVKQKLMTASHKLTELNTEDVTVKSGYGKNTMVLTVEEGDAATCQLCHTVIPVGEQARWISNVKVWWCQSCFHKQEMKYLASVNSYYEKLGTTAEFGNLTGTWEVTSDEVACAAKSGQQHVDSTIPAGVLAFHFNGVDGGWWCEKCADHYLAIGSANDVPVSKKNSVTPEPSVDLLDLVGTKVQWKTGAWGTWIVTGKDYCCANCNVSSHIPAGSVVVGWGGWSENAHTIWCPKCIEKAKHEGNIKYFTGAATSNQPKKSPGNCLGCGKPICNLCGVCETDGCKFATKFVASKADQLQYNYLLASSQKIRGVVALTRASVMEVPLPLVAILDETDLIPEALRQFGGYPLFARPCPQQPRHGFVESIVINEKSTEARLKTIAELWKKVRHADPEGEMLLMPYKAANNSAVITPSRLSVGPGTDGATSGNGATSLPLVGVPIVGMGTDIVSNAGINQQIDDPYMEILCGKGQRTWATQLRAGVKLGTGIGMDFIPAKVKVQYVLKATGDLLEWEKLVRELNPGTVIDHVGGSLVSHYGVHCMFNKVPIVTSHHPEVGETFPETQPLEAPDLGAVRQGIFIGLTSNKLSSSDAAKHAVDLMLTVAHNAAAMKGEFGVWLGMAVGIMLRCGLASSLGEARHPGRISSGSSGSRTGVHTRTFSDYFWAHTFLGPAQWLFKHYDNWGAGYGGKKWARCTASIIRLDYHVRLFVRKPTQARLAMLVTALHSAINQAHNGGWWLNKFGVGSSSMDAAMSQHLTALAAAAPSAYTWHDAKVTEEESVQIAELLGDLGKVEVLQPPELPLALFDEEPYGEHVASDADDEDNDADNEDEPEDEPPEKEPELISISKKAAAVSVTLKGLVNTPLTYDELGVQSPCTYAANMSTDYGAISTQSVTYASWSDTQKYFDETLKSVANNIKGAPK